MRIISGALKGRRILAPKNLPARPTTDYAKESLFNILAHDIHWPETQLLDLFCGIGSISLEGISRGASKAIAIDSHPATIAWLKKTSLELSISDRLVPMKTDVFKFLKTTDFAANLIFADPPYDFLQYEQFIEEVISKSCFNDALFVLEHRQKRSFTEHPNFVEDRTYGEVGFTFFRCNQT